MKALQRILDYRRIQTIGDFTQEADKVLFVTATMLRPGKHQYLVKVEGGSYSANARAFIARPRIEPSLP